MGSILFVGVEGGAGEFTLTGGTVSASTLMIGAGGQGTVTVSGGSLLVNNISLAPGEDDSGALTVADVTITTSQILAGGGEASLNLSDVNLAAKSNQESFVAGFAEETVSLLGDVTINTVGHNVGVVAALNGLGNLIKTGLGELRMSGNHTYTGATLVSQGTLNVAGSIASSSLTTVTTGGTLIGTGTVGATLLSGGTFLAGTATAPGTLTVNGGLTATSGTLSFPLAELGTSRLVLDGSGFSLTGNSTGTVTVNILDFNGSAPIGRYTLVSVVDSAVTPTD